LRDAVALSAPGATLAVPAGHYVLTLGAITISNNLTIAGAGARTTVIDGNASSGIFSPPTVLTIEIDDVSLINGNAVTGDPNIAGLLAGGAIDGSGTLTLRRCRIANNQAAVGGGIAWTGTLTIDESTIAGNTATAIIEGPSGGGIFSEGGPVTMTNSTLTGNTTAGFGGGAGFLFVSPLNLLNVTVTANQAALAGGGLALIAAGSLANSIVAGNPGGDCFLVNSPLATDHSLDSDHSCGLTDAGSKPGINPLLGPLANNGGPTDTVALLAGSPAIDAGDNATCLPTDQRGVTRPQGPACDMGAYEVETPQGQIAALIAQINALVTAGSLAQNKANPLITKLNQVVNKLNAGQTTAACGQLGAFINQLNADIRNGTLTPAEGQPLLDAAHAIQASIGC
jgi:hypothetical protein